MKADKVILNPKKPIKDIIKQSIADKKYIQDMIASGREQELKGKFKFVKSL